MAAMGFIHTTSHNLTPQKEQNWDARSKELLATLLAGGEFRPLEMK